MDEKDIVQAVLDNRFKKLKEQNARLTQDVNQLQQRTEKSGTAFTARSFVFADRPLAVDGMTGFAFAFITDGRKTGEGGGAGTGVFAYYNPPTNTWLRVSDDVAVAV